MATLVPRFREAVRARLDAIGVPAKAILVELEYVIHGREQNSIVTPLTSSVRLANVLVKASPNSLTDEAVLPGV